MTPWYQAHLIAYDQLASHEENEKDKQMYKAMGAQVK